MIIKRIPKSPGYIRACLLLPVESFIDEILAGLGSPSFYEYFTAVGKGSSGGGVGCSLCDKCMAPHVQLRIVYLFIFFFSFRELLFYLDVHFYIHSVPFLIDFLSLNLFRVMLHIVNFIFYSFWKSAHMSFFFTF